MLYSTRFSTALMLATVSCFAYTESRASGETVVSVAEPCDDATSVDKRIMVSEAESLIGLGPAQKSCIVKDTSTALNVVSVMAVENKFNTGSVEVSFTSQSSALWSRIEATHIAKRMILLQGKFAVLEFVILNTRTDSKLILGAADLQEAETIARVLRGE